MCVISVDFPATLCLVYALFDLIPFDFAFDTTFILF